jgi:hypothetical protein
MFASLYYLELQFLKTFISDNFKADCDSPPAVIEDKVNTFRNARFVIIRIFVNSLLLDVGSTCTIDIYEL